MQVQGLRGNQAKLAQLSLLKGRLGLQGPPRDILEAKNTEEIGKIADDLIKAVNREAVAKLDVYLNTAVDDVANNHCARMSAANLHFLADKDKIIKDREAAVAKIQQQETDLISAIADARLSHFKTAQVNLDEDVEIGDGFFIKRRVAAAFPGTFMSARFGGTFKPATDGDLPTFLSEEHDQEIVELIVQWMCNNAESKPADVVGAAIAAVTMMTKNPALIALEVNFLLG